MKKNTKNISNPDELDKYLQYTSPTTWIVLGSIILLLVGFFAWSILYKIKDKITGLANISGGEVTLHIEESKLSKLEVGQKVYILDKVGEISSINDKQPIVTDFDLDDGEYTYTIVLREVRPIDFLISK